MAIIDHHKQRRDRCFGNVFIRAGNACGFNEQKALFCPGQIQTGDDCGERERQTPGIDLCRDPKIMRVANGVKRKQESSDQGSMR